MKRFTIYKGKAEIKKIKDIETGCASFTNTDGEIFETFDTEREATEKIRALESEINKIGNVYMVTEYFLQEETWNEEFEEFQYTMSLEVTDTEEALKEYFDN